MWRRREKTGTALYLDARRSDLVVLDEERMQHGYDKAPSLSASRTASSLLIPQHFPSPSSLPVSATGGDRHRCEWLDRYDDDRKPN